MRRRPIIRTDDDCYDEHILRRNRNRLKLWNFSVTAWFIAGITFALSLSLLVFIVFPLVTGYITPWQLAVGFTHALEDITKDLVLDCPRLLSSRMQDDIRSNALGISWLHYRPSLNISALIDRRDVFVLKAFLSGTFLSGISLTTHSLKLANTELDVFGDWVVTDHKPIGELFIMNEDGLPVLAPCLAGEVELNLHSKSVFRKVHAKVAENLGYVYDTLLSSDQPIIPGTLMTRGASMYPRLHHYCDAKLLVQISGDSLVYFRVAVQSDSLSGVGLSRWLGIHLFAGDAMSWFPGMVFYMEPQSEWSLTFVITEPDAHNDGMKRAEPRFITNDALDDSEFIKEYVQLMAECHGRWPPGNNTRQ